MKKPKSRKKSLGARKRLRTRRPRSWRRDEIRARQVAHTVKLMRVETRMMELLPLNDTNRGELRNMAFGLGLKQADLPKKADDPSGELICRLIAEREIL